MTKVVRKIVVFLVLALLAAGAVMLIRHRKAELAALKPPPQRAAVVKTSIAAKGSLPLSRHYLGTIQPVISADLAPRAEGHLKSVTRDIGDLVEEGEVVAQIDSRLPLKERQAVSAELAGARDELQQRKKELERRKALFAEGHLPEDRLDESRRIYLLARARMKRLQAELQSASIAEGYTDLQAPFDGIISDRFMDPGEMVKPGQPVYRMESLEAGYKVLVDLNRAILPDLSGGERAVLTSGSRQKEARIKLVHPSFHEGKLATAEIRESVSPFGLPSGAVIGVNIYHGVAEGWVIPIAAVLKQAENSFVFTVDSANLARKHQVQVKGYSNKRLVVEGPLSSGDRVITGSESMLLQLADGSPVRPLNLPAE